MTDGIRITTLNKHYLWRNQKNTYQRPPGLLWTSQYEHQCLSLDSCLKQSSVLAVRQPAAQTVRDLDTFSDLTPMKLATLFLFLWITIITCAWVGYMHSGPTYYLWDWHSLRVIVYSKSWSSEYGVEHLSRSEGVGISEFRELCSFDTELLCFAHEAREYSEAEYNYRSASVT